MESDAVVHDELAGLVAKAQDGDDSAFRRLVEATYKNMYTLAYRLTGDEEDARDVTQEAYLRAHRALPQFRGDSQFSTWMYRITSNCASSYLQRRSKHRHVELPDASQLREPSFDADPESQSDAAELRDRLVEALDELPPKLRAVVVLRDIYELPHDAIAAELGISSTACKVRLHRARHQLRSELFPGLEQVDSRAV